MKILEHGKYFGRFEAKCPVCGCIYEVDGPKELTFDYEYMSLYGRSFVSKVRVRCPECEAFDNFNLQDTSDENVTEM